MQHFIIRLDGNQGFTASSCLKMLGKLERKKIAIELIRAAAVETMTMQDSRSYTPFHRCRLSLMKLF